MRFSDYITLAFRNMRRQKLRSALTIFAVSIGATSVVFMLAIIFSAKSFLIKQFETAGVFRQVAVSPKTDILDYSEAQRGGGGQCDSCVKLTDSIVGKISNIPHVSAVSRIINSGSFEAIIYGDKKLTLNQIKAYDANGVIINNVLAGRDIEPSDKEGVITMTSDYANKFGFKNNYQALVGKQVNLLSRDWYQGVGANIPKPNFNNQGPDNGPPKSKPVTLKATVVGIIDSSGEGQTIRVPLEWAKQMNQNRRWETKPQDQRQNEALCRSQPGPCQVPQPQPVLIIEDFIKQNGYDSLIVKVDATSNATGVAEAIKKLGVGAADAGSFIRDQVKVFNILGLVFGGIGGIALTIAAIGVINTMIMSMLERTREIGVMRAVGAKRSTVRHLFTIEAAWLGLWGGIIGIIAGYGLTKVANIILNQQLASNGLQAHNVISLPLWLILAVIGITTLIGTLSGLYPAHRAAKLNPVDALRYE